MSISNTNPRYYRFWSLEIAVSTILPKYQNLTSVEIEYGALSHNIQDISLEFLDRKKGALCMIQQAVVWTFLTNRY